MGVEVIENYGEIQFVRYKYIFPYLIDGLLVLLVRYAYVVVVSIHLPAAMILPIDDMKSSMSSFCVLNEHISLASFTDSSQI